MGWTLNGNSWTIPLFQRGQIYQLQGKILNGNSLGPVEIPVEAIKVEIDTSIDMLCSLLGKIWQEEVVPANGKMGELVKLPRKGDWHVGTIDE